MAFLTDFRENPSTLSTDGDVVAAEDIALLGENTHHVSRRPSAGSFGLKANSRLSITAYWWSKTCSFGPSELERVTQSHCWGLIALVLSASALISHISAA